MSGRTTAGRFRMRLLVALFLALSGIGGATALRRAWLQTERREASLPDLEAMARRSPFDGPLLALLGGRQAQAGEFAASATSLQQAVASGENQPDVWKTWAAAVAASGDRVGSASVLRLGLQTVRNPNAQADLQAALDRARALDKTSLPGAYAHAISPEGLSAMIARRTQGSFLNGLAIWWGRSHPAQSGFATREVWARQRMTDAEALHWWGLALMRNRRLPAALEPLSRAVELAPSSAEAHLALADLLRQQGVSGKAGLEYEACLRLRRNWLPALIGLGQVALDKSLIALSVSVFQKAVVAGPHSADAWIGMGRAYYSTHIQIGQALTAFEQAARLAPRRTDYFNDYFKALRLTFHYPEAEALIRRRILAAPQDAQARYLLALLLEEYQPTPEREAEAETQLRTSLHLAASEATQMQLAALLMRHNRPVESVPLVQEVLQLDNLNVQAMRTLAKAYRQAGRPRLADTFLRDSASQMRYAQEVGDTEDQEHRNPGDADVHERLSRLYAQGGRPAEARQEHEFMVLLRTHPVQARRGIQTLDSATSISHPFPKN